MTVTGAWPSRIVTNDRSAAGVWLLVTAMVKLAVVWLVVAGGLAEKVTVGAAAKIASLPDVAFDAEAV